MPWPLLLLACTRPAPCPPGTAPDPARAAHLAALAGLAEGPPTCFGPGVEAALDPAGTARLDATWPDAALAGRLVHLATHRAHPAEGGPADPEACLARALAAEVGGWDAELRVRARLGALDAAGAPPFTAAWLSGGAPAVAAWLQAHPAGAPTVPAGRDALARRCGLP